MSVALVAGMNSRFTALVLLCSSCVAAEDPAEAVANAEGEGDVVVSIEGTILDWQTGTAVAGALVEIDEAWAGPTFPTNERPAKTALRTDEDGHFGPIDVAYYDRRPIGLFRVTGEGLAQTASDLRLPCPFLNDAPYRCSDVDHTILVPDSELESVWRAELEAGGMADANATGLTVLQFLDWNGLPAAGVAAYENPFFAEERPFAVGEQVRYLGADRATFTSVDTEYTAESGLAVIGSANESEDVLGVAFNGPRWATIGVLFAPGWIFVESTTN